MVWILMLCASPNAACAYLPSSPAFARLDACVTAARALTKVSRRGETYQCDMIPEDVR